jgi:hypothetical protein
MVPTTTSLGMTPMESCPTSQLYSGAQNDHTHLPSFEGVDMRAPRYGPPAPQKIPWLPPDFAPRSPPLYYGYPHPPYLPGPKHFNPKVLAALVLRQCRPLDGVTELGLVPCILQNWPVGEVAYNCESHKAEQKGHH